MMVLWSGWRGASCNILRLLENQFAWEMCFMVGVFSWFSPEFKEAWFNDLFDGDGIKLLLNSQLYKSEVAHIISR
jgi:hypothetical protein